MGMGLSLAFVSLCIQMVTGTFHTRPITYFTWVMVALAASLGNLQLGVKLNPQRLKNVQL